MHEYAYLSLRFEIDFKVLVIAGLTCWIDDKIKIVYTRRLSIF